MTIVVNAAMIILTIHLLTQTVTQTRKKAGGYRRTQWIAHRAESTQKRRKALRSNALRRASYLHTQEVTGSSPAVSTKNEKSELLPLWECVRIFHLYQRYFLLLFMPGGWKNPPGVSFFTLDPGRPFRCSGCAESSEGEPEGIESPKPQA